MTIGQTQFTVEQRRADVAARYLRGELQSEIAAVYGLSRQQITADLAAIRAQWRASSIRDWDEKKAEELAKIDEVERQYWLAWERSQKDKEIATQDQRDDPIEVKEKDAKGNTVTRMLPKTRKRMSLRKEGQSGNPAYLDGILKCIDRRCQILGLDAPKRFIISDEDWDRMTPDQLARLADGEPPEKVLSA